MFLCTSTIPTVTESTSELGPFLGAWDPLSRLVWFIFNEKEMSIKPENTFTLQSNYLFALPKAASSFIVFLSSPLLFACVLQGWCLVLVMGRPLKPVNRGYERFFLENCNILQQSTHGVVRFLVSPRLPGLILLQLIYF